MSGLSSAFARLGLFGKKVDEEDLGEAIQADSVGGGGHASRQSKITKEQLRVSHAIKKFLVDQKVFSQNDAGLDLGDSSTPALKELLDKPHIDVPKHLTERSHPLTEYFISSSHNTYLLAHQLYGNSSAVAYETALNTGSRCVEIDAWDNEEDPNEPKVTHGYTLASHIPFRSICETIRDVVDSEATKAPLESGYHPAPILLSLENHCGAYGQARLVSLMREVWGDRLLSKAVREHGAKEQDGGEHVTLNELGSKIAVIVEYHLPSGKKEAESSEEEDEDEDTRKEHQAYREEEKKAPTDGIIPELAELGVYAQSVKPTDRSWFEATMRDPHHHLINISESGLLSLLPPATDKIARHNSQHLMRVFPKGTRISSKNLNPVPFWGLGAQICALNWQTFDHSMQLNEALFAGSDGYVLKPDALRAGGSGKLSTGRKKILTLHVAGVSDIPVPQDREADEIRPYVTCTLVHPDDLHRDPPKCKTAVYKQHKLGIVHRGESPPVTDPIWDEILEWEFEENELVFLRVLVKSNDKLAKNPVFVVAAVRLSYVVRDWCFIRMLDLKGRETHCTLLCKFDVRDA